MANPTVIALLIAITATAATAATPPGTQYTNHTVGGPTGWFFNSTTNSSFTNYTSWAASETFNIGDFLIFATSSNQTVIETYNETTYVSCNVHDSSDDNTLEYNGGSDGFGNSQTIAVELTQEGPTYYFSGDRIQCQRGMAFAINVNKGLGLPSDAFNGTQPPGSGGSRSGANVREGSGLLLALVLFLGL